ncbi:MbeB family mobilization protein [Serratia sp. BW106]|uniref:MbeB family mobilization protein n=1 Tax=Serratia sp. BW106 TaxID=1884636 RepID=UPI000BFFF954|nr:MbeB family mobilization protein [Serratia sp. BW106]
MSKLLKLATDLEQKSREQASDTEQMLKRAFSAHERSVSEALTSSGKRISDAIAAHEQDMTAAMQSNRLSVLRMVGRTWLTLMMVSVLLMGFSGSVLWWLGQKIVSNMETLSQQEDALAKLNAKTWGIEYREGTNGRFLVLPKGMKADPEWKVEKRNAVKLVKE